METNVGLISNIAMAFDQGGIWMWAIFAAQIVSIAIIAERVYALYLRRNNNQKRLAQTFEQDIKQGRIDIVLSKAQTIGKDQPIASVIQAGAQAAMDMGGREEIQSKMDEILVTENTRMEKRTGFLAMLGNVGTLLGLLGTIIGLIQSFASVSSANPVEKAALLTQGIAMAMNTTAYGLIMAIPALVSFAILQNRANVLSDDLNQGALKIYNLLSFSFDSVPSKSSKTSKRSS